ncbi:MAG: EutN/CcmL family microcompartment protein [Bacteroidetes bacterium]|nr:EutN/CcmL family microcompartment protein [Bacteroidota bacterium]
MKLGKVTGKVWATAKDPKLNGLTLYIMQPVDEAGKALGGELVAVDTVGSREGDLVYWVGGAEATFAFPQRQIPSDVSIIGLVDRLDLHRD